MKRMCVLLMVGCLLLVSSCTKSEPPTEDSATSSTGVQPADQKPAENDPKDPPKVIETTEEAADNGPDLKVGDKAPAFVLKDQNGKEHKLEDLIKQGKTALVFYRSADW